jgi:hypothetical protein
MAYTNIDDPSAYFQITLYTGNGADNRALTNTGNSDLQPDFVWVKGRNQAEWHNVYDSSRGANKALYTNSTYQEETLSEIFESFDTNGFTVSYNSAYNSVFTNKNSTTYVAWQWKANGGTTVSNSSGSITSTVQANQDAGFSIVTYTGTGSATTVGHGLGAAPAMIIFKSRDATRNWIVYHHQMGTTPNQSNIDLNTTAAVTNYGAGYWNSTTPTSTVFSLGDADDITLNGTNFIAYCFAEKQGYSKFGKYKGNSSTDGTFVYLGFKPKWVMIKSTSAGVGWFMHDTKRSTTNVMDDYLRADVSSQEGTSGTINIDFLSNGFKLRYNNNTNFSSHDYVYMAFAENPFVTSTGVPTTAR